VVVQPPQSRQRTHLCTQVGVVMWEGMGLGSGLQVVTIPRDQLEVGMGWIVPDHQGDVVQLLNLIEDACWLGQQLFQLLLRRWLGCWTTP